MMKQKANGIGGIFFRARNPQKLGEWYREHLGVGGECEGVWQQESGYTVFAPFPADTDYFGRDTQQFMLNFRVGDLDAMIAQLKAAGIEVETRAEWDSEVGRFARVVDPEGNPVELWEPAVG
ncbi:hypothetical protein EL18_02555 [Nitratireductor basaltis]|uniref:VOC domain-containing protein n=2 Tax=Nitratireductor basaltis TaxID=472175 RepID=A0A084U5R9_9HYPH|nr:hypothetical protein EL18_02555 [Nitratireductor basaltis]